MVLAMRKKAPLLFLSTFICTLMVVSSIFGTGIRYGVRADDDFTYEVKCAKYAEDDSKVDYANRHDLNTSYVHIRIDYETVMDTTNESIGSMFLNMWYMIPGQGWEAETRDYEIALSYNVNNYLESEELHTNLTLTDGKITRADVIRFFKGSSFMVPLGISEQNKTMLGQSIATRLNNAYFGPSPLSVREPNSYNYTITNIGLMNYTLRAEYDNKDGALNLWHLKSTTNSSHSLIIVQRMKQDINIVVEQDLGIDPVFITVVVGIVIVIVAARKRFATPD